MQDDYRIETLVKTFSDQAKQAEINFQQHMKRYKENYPGDELPTWMIENFNIARALSVMAFEIEKLRQKTGCE